ncbi:MAG TPA: hypothetical protein VIV40_21920, partial [Kofleriaceae bacterium]
MQLRVTCLLLLATQVAYAEDRAEVSTTVFAEQRDGGEGGLTVLHPQADLGTDIGRHVTLDLGYAADAVSGATSTTYQVDATSSATRFSDLRNEGRMGLGFQGRRSRITFSGLVGTERDYITRAIGGSASIDLPGRNTTVGVAYTH